MRFIDSLFARLRTRTALAFVSGMLLGFCFPPYRLIFLIPIAFAVLYVSMKRADTARENARLTAIFAVIFYLTHTYWFASFHPVALPAVLLLAGLWFGAWGFTVKYIGLNPFVLTASWILLQYLIGTVYPPFPWSRVATALAVHPVLIQPIRWFGELVWGGFFVLLGCEIGRFWDNRHSNSAFVWTFLTLIMVCIGGGLWTMTSTTLSTVSRDVLLVQPNLSSTYNPDPDRPNQREILRELTRTHASPGDIIVWPETAIMSLPLEITSNGTVSYRDPLAPDFFRRVRPAESELIFGLQFYDPKPNSLDYLNGAAHIDSGNRPVGFYTKRIPVPGGEYIPGMNQYEWIRSLGRVMGTMGYRPSSKGGLLSLKTEDDSMKAGIQICYEDAFPGYVRRQVRSGADLLINISNDSWSRSTASHWQHFYRARIRAVATGRTLIRNGNTGVSAVINPLGQVNKLLKPFQKGVLRQNVFEHLEDPTMQVQWGEWITTATFVLLIMLGTIRTNKYGG